MITVEELSYTYPEADEPSLQNIWLEVEKGYSLSIMGSNGSGKSTLARCLNGLLLPQTGSVMVDGFFTHVSSENEKIRQLVGMVFQNPDSQIVSTTVEREISFGLENLGIPRVRMLQLINSISEEFHLAKYRNRSPHHLSGGEKQLLALASVLVMEPSYLILDEPTSLLDPFYRKQILDTIFLSRNKRFQSISSILITQFPEETFYTDRLIIMDKGRIVLDDSPHQVFRHRDELKKIGVGIPILYQLEVEHLFDEN